MVNVFVTVRYVLGHATCTYTLEISKNDKTKIPLSTYILSQIESRPGISNS